MLKRLFNSPFLLVYPETNFSADVTWHQHTEKFRTETVLRSGFLMGTRHLCMPPMCQIPADGRLAEPSTWALGKASALPASIQAKSLFSGQVRPSLGSPEKRSTQSILTSR